MKYLEIWDPLVNMKSIFTSSLIGNIRVQIVSRLKFSKYNSLSEVQKHVKDLETFVSASSSSSSSSSLMLFCLFMK